MYLLKGKSHSSSNFNWSTWIYMYMCRIVLLPMCIVHEFDQSFLLKLKGHFCKISCKFRDYELRLWFLSICLFVSCVICTHSFPHNNMVLYIFFLKNFWMFCERFTHSDVIAQLKRLAQVNSEIGLCRVSFSYLV